MWVFSLKAAAPTRGARTTQLPLPPGGLYGRHKVAPAKDDDDDEEKSLHTAATATGLGERHAPPPPSLERRPLRGCEEEEDEEDEEFPAERKGEGREQL